MKITLVGVYVDDPIEAFKFYTKVLGFKERMFMPEMKLAIITSPEEPNGTGLMLEPNENPIAKNYQNELYKAGIPVIVFGVENVQQEYERLIGQGVIFKKMPTKTDWGIDAIFDDTFGNYVQLAQLQ